MNLDQKKNELKNSVNEIFKEKNINFEISDEDIEKSLTHLSEVYKDIHPTLEHAFENRSMETFAEGVYNNLLINEKYQEKMTHKYPNFEYKNSKKCCIAPHSTIDFDTMGTMRVCCYNSKFFLGKYPETSINDAWNNPEREKFINQLSQKKFPLGCELCMNQVLRGNISNALFSTFDQYDNIIDKKFPVVLNFEFGTICNYECIMCGGKWSSSIRKNREKLPALKSPYDDNFIEQLKPFLLKAKILNFLGGEPFLNSIYYKILNYVFIRNPNVHVCITTNGSIYNSKIEQYLKNLKNLKVVISLDSLNEKTYNFIRKNGNFQTVMENLKKFQKSGNLSGIAICPMIQNIYELPELIKFAFDNNLHFALNTVVGHLGGKIKGIHQNENDNKYVWTGSDSTMEMVDDFANPNLIPEVSLFTLPKDELVKIIEHLKQFSFVDNLKDSYKSKYEDFIKSLEFN